LIPARESATAHPLDQAPRILLAAPSQCRFEYLIALQVSIIFYFRTPFFLFLKSIQKYFSRQATGGKVLSVWPLEALMNGFSRFTRRETLILLVFLSSIVVALAWPRSGRALSVAPTADDPAALLAAYRHVEVASVSDAIEQLSGRKMYMSHRMRPIFNTKFAGFAVTVSLKKEANDDPNALNGMLAAIDQGTKDSVYVMVVEDGADIAGMGGLMGTAMSAREFSGAIIDGGVRDVAYLQKIGFPVYALGIVPSTSIHHYRVAGANIPVVCDGVEVKAGDVVVADSDGVVVVPRSDAPKVLALAEELDFKEHSMYAYIEKLKSIQEAVKKFGRL
jgi:regulator of RNase E activity RraA